jgi:hypothetical protein
VSKIGSVSKQQLNDGTTIKHGSPKQCGMPIAILWDPIVVRKKVVVKKFG